jgi:putative phosphoribosyl transferase
MVFASREDAGQKLGRYLKDQNIRADLVLGLPRGGVIVAAQVAHILQLPLDVLVVRKIGHPWHREFAVGAMAENGVVLFDERAIGKNPLIRLELNEILEEEKERLRAYQARFRHEPLDLTGKAVLLVDDGLATGSTTEAAVLSAKKQNASQVIVAVPVASTNAVERLRKVADDVRALWVDPEFDAVGRYYEVFSQTTDEEVLDLLKAEAGTVRKE